MKRRLLAGLIPVALTLAGPVQADIYAFVDSNGVRHLSNVPNDPRYKLVMRTPAYSKKAAQASSFAPSNLYAPGVMPRNYASQAARSKPFRVNEQNRQRFNADVNRIAAQYRLEPALMHAVISAESAYNPWAVSPKGAMGLMQLMPGTAERFGVSNAYDPVANMHGGARYLRWLLDRFNNTQLAVAAYNAGEGAVQKYGNQIPPYKETQTYVTRVLNFYQQYRLSGLYNTSTNGNALALNSSSYPGRSSGVTIITPRTSGRFARTPVKAASSSLNIAPKTYLTPTGDRVIIGNSGGSRDSIRSSVNVVDASRFVGNNK
ncbi:MAG TPA: transglycosylase SLT domain-containing protein [Candidatus Competibacteraceae bacterium]|nr:lytic transglycosylase domain-containing protein [Candidatus Competibacteraceae bacterium]MCP5133806.1 lytic transglycosylase domain-containing protein [Gammaproteobacteria bacterium]HPF58130.1 transglycosylase SLT domain-containing protein [Candidatus Competibacteraceae bacterium]HRY18119.1 transglycosylase SLT domain-containing protein [Candidatus Competibacteraceae bacterium]